MDTGADNAILDVFEEKLQKFIRMYDGLKQENLQLRQAIEAGQSRESELQKKLDRISADYENLKTTKVLSVSGYDLESTRKRVSGLVREIDRCIDMLQV